MWCFVIRYVFKKFKEVSFEYYVLDPFQYFNRSGLSFGTMFRMESLNLESTSDVDMHQLIEKGMKCGVSYIAKRYIKTMKKRIESSDDSDLSQ